MRKLTPYTIEKHREPSIFFTAMFIVTHIVLIITTISLYQARTELENQMQNDCDEVVIRVIEESND